jgi:superfamily II DNA/RNA helicase
VFCNRKRDISEVCRFMRSKGIKAEQLHGDMEQEQRTVALNSFKGGASQVLVCSDVAARGLDVQGMSHVFNWDVPNHPEDYVHRIGRTGRANATGRAFTFSTPNDFKAVALIQKLIGKTINVFNLGDEFTPPPQTEDTADLEPTERTHKKHYEPRRNRPDRKPEHRAPSKTEHRQAKPPQEKRSRHEEHHNILAEENNGTFGGDVPAFLKGK